MFWYKVCTVCFLVNKLNKMISTSWYLLKQLYTSFHWAPKTVSEQWLISQPCHIHSTSFKADRGRKLLFQIKKTEGKLEISRSLNFYNASLNYAAICLLFICVLLLLYGPAFKKSMQNGSRPSVLCQHIFSQNCLLEKFVFQCRFHILYRCVFQELCTC